MRIEDSSCFFFSLFFRPYLDQPATVLPFKNLRGVLEFCVAATEVKWEQPDVIQALDSKVKNVCSILFTSVMTRLPKRKKDFTISVFFFTGG